MLNDVSVPKIKRCLSNNIFYYLFCFCTDLYILISYNFLCKNKIGIVLFMTSILKTVINLISIYSYHLNFKF